MLELIETDAARRLGGVPTMLIALLDHPTSPAATSRSLRFALAGGAPVPPALVRRVEATARRAVLDRLRPDRDARR